jgi:hypothetical protein
MSISRATAEAIRIIATIDTSVIEEYQRERRRAGVRRRIGPKRVRG